MTKSVDQTVAASNWWTGDELTALVAKVRPYTMVREGALRDLALHVRAVLVNGTRGDFVECGVWRGGAAFLIAECLRKAGERDRKVWLFDSFEGLPPPQQIDGRAAAEYATGEDRPWSNCEASLEDVRGSAAALGLTDRLHFVKGWFDTTLPSHRAVVGDVALLRLDCDWYSSVKCCLDNLYDNVVPNGFVVLDDYFTFDGAAVAVHEFLGTRALPHRLENVVSEEDGYSGYRCALFRKGGATWHETKEWLERSDRAAAEIEAHVPGAVDFILIDSELPSVRPGMTRGRSLVERDGVNWGPPADGVTAIAELENRRGEGLRTLVFTWNTFWWLDHYTELAAYLNSRYRSTHQSRNVRVFDLR